MNLRIITKNDAADPEISRNSVSHKIDFKAQRLRNGHADSVEVKAKKF